ncbi:uncharacterized protein TM35_000102690 [Trypanosoma theileri]|uniref:Uncharacterized protein n=1 Tax=Trypanosoma theileri TaxID=67003 RepID=A0A1X0NZH5_9TRYP|nr:uncharacterized protein TM35_000102690 [Trypanosoma theileri]ORC90001.1 hypothetical protein TM35_000102690 [Trypanosoma theileri]
MMEKSRFRGRLFVVKDEIMKLRNDHHTIRSEINELFRMSQEGFHVLHEQSDKIQYSITEESKVIASQIAADVVNDMVRQTVFDRLREQGIVLQQFPGPPSSLTDWEWTQNQLYDIIVNPSREQIAAAILKNHDKHENEDVESKEKKKEKNKKMGEEVKEEINKEKESNKEMEMDKHDEAPRDPGRPLLYRGQSEKSPDGQRGVASFFRQVNSLGEERGGGVGKKTAESIPSTNTHHVTGGGAMDEKTPAALPKHTLREGKE